MAHIKSITLRIDGKWRNIPSMVNGKKVSQAKAKQHAEDNNNIGPGFKTMPLALLAAGTDSRSADKKIIVKKKKPRTRSKK